MSDYKKMYYLLFNKITDIINELQTAQLQTEEMYAKSEEQIVKFNMLKKEREDSASTIPQK